MLTFCVAAWLSQLFDRDVVVNAVMWSPAVRNSIDAKELSLDLQRVYTPRNPADDDTRSDSHFDDQSSRDVRGLGRVIRGGWLHAHMPRPCVRSCWPMKIVYSTNTTFACLSARL